MLGKLYGIRFDVIRHIDSHGAPYYQWTIDDDVYSDAYTGFADSEAAGIEAAKAKIISLTPKHVIDAVANKNEMVTP